QAAGFPAVQPISRNARGRIDPIDEWWIEARNRTGAPGFIGNAAGVPQDSTVREVVRIVLIDDRHYVAGLGVHDFQGAGVRVFILVRHKPQEVGETQLLVCNELTTKPRRRRVEIGCRIVRVQESDTAYRFDPDVLTQWIEATGRVPVDVSGRISDSDERAA